MTRIAVVSDIHANIHALNALLRFLDDWFPVSKILNLGDFIQIGPNPLEVFDIVMKDGRFVNIMGNSEAMFFDQTMLRQYEHEKAHQEWTVRQLGEERMNRLKAVPLQRTAEISGVRFFMTHARPGAAAGQPLLYQQRPFEEFFMDYPGDSEYVLIGHTHLPLHAVYWNGRPIVNPGSVGCGKDGRVRFVTMELEDDAVSVSYCQLKYDKERVLLDYRERSVPCADRFISLFY